jgi:hypothetical protein
MNANRISWSGYLYLVHYTLHITTINHNPHIQLSACEIEQTASYLMQGIGVRSFLLVMRAEE